MVLFETERLIVRTWEEKDCQDLYEICSDKITNKYLTYPLYTSYQNAVDRIAYMQTKTTFKDNDWAIELKETGKVIGSIGIVSFKEKAGGIAEIGYQLGSNYFRCGYMTEVVTSMIKYLFDNNLVSRIEAKHDVNNPASGKVMLKSGMTFEGVLRKSDANNASPRIDCATYSILKEEYEDKTM